MCTYFLGRAIGVGAGRYSRSSTALHRVFWYFTIRYIVGTVLLLPSTHHSNIFYTNWTYNLYFLLFMLRLVVKCFITVTQLPLLILKVVSLFKKRKRYQSFLFHALNVVSFVRIFKLLLLFFFETFYK